MRIAIDARMALDRPTGIGKYILNLLENIILLDNINEYVFIVNSDGSSKLARADNVKIRMTRCRPMSVIEQFVLPALLKDEKIDIFHATSFVVPRYIPCKRVITLHDLTHILFPDEFGRLVPFYYRCIVKPSALMAQRIIADSENTKNDIVKLFNVKTDDVTVIKLAAENCFKVIKDKSAINIVKRKYGISKKFIMYNGNKKRHKNVGAILKAYYMLKEKHKVDCSLVVVGEHDRRTRETDHTGLEILTEQRGSSKGIIYTGRVNDDDLALLYNAAEVFVFPSLYEGFGLPPLEAMSCGCPVVVSNRSSLPEVCGDAGCYVDPESVDSICNGMYAMITDETARNCASIKGLRRAELFSWKQCAKETLSVYKETYDETGDRS